MNIFYIVTVDDELFGVGGGSPPGGVEPFAGIVALEGAADVLEQQFARVDVAQILFVSVIRAVFRTVGQLLQQFPVQVPSQ